MRQTSVTITNRAIVLASAFARNISSSLFGLKKNILWKFPSPTCPTIVPVPFNSCSCNYVWQKVHFQLSEILNIAAQLPRNHLHFKNVQENAA